MHSFQALLIYSPILPIKRKKEKKEGLKLLSWVSACFRYSLPNIWLKLGAGKFSEAAYLIYFKYFLQKCFLNYVDASLKHKQFPFLERLREC